MSDQQPSADDPTTNVTPNGPAAESAPETPAPAAAETPAAETSAAPAAPAAEAPAPPVWPPHAPPPPAPTPPAPTPPAPAPTQPGGYAPPPASGAPGGYPPPAPPAPPTYGQPYPPAGFPAYVPTPPTSTSAIIGLVLAIASWFICPVILAVVALVLARSSSKEIEESAGQIGGAGLNTATRIISWINIGLYALIIIGLAVFFLLAAFLSAVPATN